jgi:type VI secretion system protein ImpH
MNRRETPSRSQKALDAAGSSASPEDVAAALAPVAEALRNDPHSFGFFQAVRLLERLSPSRGRVGAFDDPASEVVRIGVNPDLGFPPSEIHSLNLDGPQPKMQVNFMGLTGPQGVLPHHYSLLIAERQRAKDNAFADFLDLFHHRIISLFYEAWREHRVTIAREDGTRDRLAAHLADLVGLGLTSTQERRPFPDEALIYRAGLLAPQSRGAAALQQLLEDFFDLRADVEQFVGGWYPLQPDDLCEIGDDDGDANILGGGAVAGDEAWDQQSSVRVKLGPLPREQFDSFLPGGSSHESLVALLRFYGNNQFDFEVQLILAREDVRGVRLGEAGAEQRLGWSTWISSGARPEGLDADETILSLKARTAA